MSVLTKAWWTALIVFTTIYCIGMFGGLAWYSLFSVALVGIIGLVLTIAIGIIVAVWRDAV